MSIVRSLIHYSPISFVAMCLSGIVFIICLLYLGIVFYKDRDNKVRCWASSLFTLGAGIFAGINLLDFLYDRVHEPNKVVGLVMWGSYITASALFWILTVYRLLAWVTKHRSH